MSEQDSKSENKLEQAPTSNQDPTEGGTSAPTDNANNANVTAQEVKDSELKHADTGTDYRNSESTDNETDEQRVTRESAEQREDQLRKDEWFYSNPTDPSAKQPPVVVEESPVIDGVAAEAITAPTNTGFRKETFDATTSAEAQIRDSDEPNLNYVGEPKHVDVPMTIMTHTNTDRQRDKHGIYLDDVQRNSAELQRAKVENREPDFENAPAITSDVVMPTEVARHAVSNAAGHVPVSFTDPVEIGINPDRLDENAEAEYVQSQPRETHEVNPDDDELFAQNR